MTAALPEKAEFGKFQHGFHKHFSPESPGIGQSRVSQTCKTVWLTYEQVSI